MLVFVDGDSLRGPCHERGKAFVSIGACDQPWVRHETANAPHLATLQGCVQNLMPIKVDPQNADGCLPLVNKSQVDGLRGHRRAPILVIGTAGKQLSRMILLRECARDRYAEEYSHGEQLSNACPHSRYFLTEFLRTGSCHTSACVP